MRYRIIPLQIVAHNGTSVGGKEGGKKSNV